MSSINEDGTTNIALIHWHDDSNQYVNEAIVAEGVVFTVGDPPEWIRIELSKDGRGISILGSGALIVAPKAYNQMHIGLSKP